MIVRVWRATAAGERRADYPLHFREQVLPKLRDYHGFSGARLLSRAVDGQVEFFVMTDWESLDFVRAFSGADIARASVAAEARAMLTDWQETVVHYDLLDGSPL